MQIRKSFFRFCAVLIIVLGMTFVALSQNYRTDPFTITTPTVTQLIAGAGNARYSVNSVGVNATSMAGTAGSYQFVIGSVDGETPGCTTGRVSLMGAFTLTTITTGGTTQQPLYGAPVFSVAGSSALCIQTTNTTTVTGFITSYR